MSWTWSLLIPRIRLKTDQQRRKQSHQPSPGLCREAIHIHRCTPIFLLQHCAKNDLFKMIMSREIGKKGKKGRRRKGVN